MPSPAANAAPFQLSVAGVGGLSVVSFRGREAISEPFAFDVDLVSVDPDVGAGAVLGARATLVRQRGDVPVEVHGVVAAFDVGDQTPDRSPLLRAAGAPAVAAGAGPARAGCSRTRPCRRSSPGCWPTTGWPAPPSATSCRACTPESEFVVQYQESDLAFVRRLLEREGAWFTFDHTGGDDVLVLARPARAVAVRRGRAGRARRRRVPARVGDGPGPRRGRRPAGGAGPAGPRARGPQRLQLPDARDRPGGRGRRRGRRTGGGLRLGRPLQEPGRRRSAGPGPGPGDRLPAADAGGGRRRGRVRGRGRVSRCRATLGPTSTATSS